MNKLRKYMYVMVVIAVLMLAVMEVIVCVLISDGASFKTILMVAIAGAGFLLFALFACIAVREVIAILRERERVEHLEQIKTVRTELPKRQLNGYLASEIVRSSGNRT